MTTSLYHAALFFSSCSREQKETEKGRDRSLTFERSFEQKEEILFPTKMFQVLESSIEGNRDSEGGQRVMANLSLRFRREKDTWNSKWLLQIHFFPFYEHLERNTLFLGVRWVELKEDERASLFLSSGPLQSSSFSPDSVLFVDRQEMSCFWNDDWILFIPSFWERERRNGMNLKFHFPTSLQTLFKRVEGGREKGRWGKWIRGCRYESMKCPCPK